MYETTRIEFISLVFFGFYYFSIIISNNTYSKMLPLDLSKSQKKGPDF